MKSCSFRVNGKIRGKARPRFNTKTGRAFKVKMILYMKILSEGLILALRL